MSLGVGLGLAAYKRSRELAMANNANQPAEWWTRKRAGTAQDYLQITVSGTTYPVFVPGVDNPDDASVTRYVP